MAALIAFAAVGRVVLAPFVGRSRAADTPLAPILQALRDLDDDDMLAMGRKLGRLPSGDSQVRAAVQPLAAALLDWRSTFDDAARREFLDLASALVSGYDRPRRSA